MGIRFVDREQAGLLTSQYFRPYRDLEFNSNMNPGVNFYEAILSRKVIEPNDWSGGANYALFRHEDSLHTFTLAYGRPQARYACWCADVVRSRFVVDDVLDKPTRRSRYLLKITAAWQDWRNVSSPVRILINGHAVYDGPFFLENVMVGWPSQYFEIAPRFLKGDGNEIEIISKTGSGNMLLISRVEILQQPDLVDFTVHSSPEAVSVDEEFWIRLHLMQDHPDIQVNVPSGLVELLRQEGELFHFRAVAAGEGALVIFESRDNRCEVVIEKVGAVRHADRVPIWIGMDGDDVRHDTTGALDRTLAHLIYGGVGNYMGFRIGIGRNTCYDLQPSDSLWQRWVGFCRDHGVAMHYSGPTDYLNGFNFPAEAGKHFSGFQFHEPYLIFQPRVAELFITDQLKSARNLQEKKEAYVDYLRLRAREERKGEVEVFSGEPALTCLYSQEAGVDALLCEPVSNVSLLYGAARGTGMKFGAHIPGDWYFGYPHDEETLRRLKLAVSLAYAYGGQIIYIESSVFKTNANDRNDWEDPYCVGVRAILRELYTFSRVDQRVGQPVASLGIVYGNLESMFWMDDDRIAETIDMGDWDRQHWGLPGSTEHRRLWAASEAWLPRVPIYDQRKESLTQMFTGTPFGPVNVITPMTSLDGYQVIAFLGWNTMTETIYERLLGFVREGGVLFLCGCHLDGRIDLDAAPVPIRGGRVSELIGADIAGPGAEVLRNIRSCSLVPTSAVRLDEHFWVNEVGSGRVYFGDFYDYPTDFSLIDRIKDLLRKLGGEAQKAAPWQIEISSPYVHYSLWQNEGEVKVYATNADWREISQSSEARISLRQGDRVEEASLTCGALTVLTLPPDVLR